VTTAAHPKALHLRGTVLPDGAVRDLFVVDGRLTYTEQADARTVLDGGWLVPGLVDAHAHLSLHSPAGDGAASEERVRSSARAHLAAGVLAIREPGSPDYASLEVGPGEGLPRTVTAGRFLAAPGRYFPGLAREVEADLLPDAAAEEFVRSGRWCKIIADFFGPGGVVEPTYPADALAEAARRVHELGGQITAHATCPEAIESVLDAGFDAIEHATMMQMDHLDAVVAGGVVIIPTLIIREGVLAAMGGIGATADVVDEVRRRFDAQPAVIRAAADRGVPVLAGTDAGLVPHGLVVGEIELLLAAGLSPEAALAAGSWRAREFLGLPGLTDGAPADVVGYRDDPRTDLEVLRRPAITILDGRLV
jgi:imidazolonepropionase-like amidohydrolase